MKSLVAIIFLGFAFLSSACTPEIGSEAWCDDLKEKSRGDWTVNEVKDFTRYCLFR